MLFTYINWFISINHLQIQIMLNKRLQISILNFFETQFTLKCIEEKITVKVISRLNQFTIYQYSSSKQIKVLNIINDLYQDYILKTT